jgi:hypothetical protein
MSQQTRMLDQRWPGASEATPAASTPSCTKVVHAVPGMHATHSVNIPRSVGYSRTRSLAKSRSQELGSSDDGASQPIMRGFAGTHEQQDEVAEHPPVRDDREGP